MSHPTPQDATDATHRDAGARQYEDLPSLTDRGDGSATESASPIDSGQTPAKGASHDDTSSRAAAHRGARSDERSDSLIVEELSERMSDDEQLDASEILVGCTDGRVLLTGEVPERSMKHRAEDIAEAVRGVQDIENHIRVSKAGESFGPGGAVRTGGPEGSGFSSQPV